jgi:hypothetical protein
MPLPPNDAGMPQAIACVFLFPEEEKVDFPFVVDGKDIGHDINAHGFDIGVIMIDRLPQLQHLDDPCAFGSMSDKRLPITLSLGMPFKREQALLAAGSCPSLYSESGEMLFE